MRLGDLLVIALFGAGCSVDPTQLVVVVDTNLRVPDELDAIAVEVEGRGVLDRRGPFLLEGEGLVELPASFGVAPKDPDSNRAVTVRIMGLLDGVERLTAFARTGFLEGEQLRLDLFLVRRCIEGGEECLDLGLVCTASGCEDPFRDPGGLPRWDGTLDTLDAASTDGGTLETDAGGGCPAGDAGRGILAWTVDESAALEVTDAAALPAGGAYVVGTFAGPVSFADGSCAPGHETGAFLVRLRPDGTVAWVTSAAGPDVMVARPLVAVDGADGESALVALGIPAGTLRIDGIEHGDGGDGLLVGVDPDGLYTNVLDIRSDVGWDGVSLVSNESGTALVGTASGRFEVDGLDDVGGAGVDLARDTAVAVRWSSTLRDPCLVPFGADGGSAATGGTLFWTDRLAVSGRWWGTLVFDEVGYVAFPEMRFTFALDGRCGTAWSSPRNHAAAAAHRTASFGDGSLLLSAYQSLDGQVEMFSWLTDGALELSSLDDLDPDRRIVALERSDDGAALLVGTLDADPPAGWLATVDRSLVIGAPTDLNVPIDAAAVDAAGATVLLAGSLEGTADIDGVAVGTPGRRQLYAVEVPVPP